VTKRVLIFGGTRFFGKRLVRVLLDEGHVVTIATRGTTPDEFGESIKRLTLDREDAASVSVAVGGQTWDVVYDNICYSPDEAQAACDIFAGTAGRYVLTSTMAVYEQGEQLRSERDFDPYRYPLKMGAKSAYSYAEGKRLAEAVLFQNASFPVCAVRFPIVLGADDYTRRLHFHVDHVKQGRPIGMPNPLAEMSFITSGEAAGFLAWLAGHTFEGPVNACSRGVLPLERIIAMIEQTVGRQAKINAHTANADMSPFGVDQSWKLDSGLAERIGFSFRDIMDWYPQLIREIAAGE
jgi:nucleoside-diphosphate-sugar epimerase